MDTAHSDFSLPVPLEALDAMLADLGLGEAPLKNAGHSLGGVLTLRWAARPARAWAGS